MASVTADGWPYMQHRGGPAGFLRHIAAGRIGFADYRGNRQYISTANLMANERVSLFLMDYPNRDRLKLVGHAKIVELAEDPAAVTEIGTASRRERVCQYVLISGFAVTLQQKTYTYIPLYQ